CSFSPIPPCGGHNSLEFGVSSGDTYSTQGNDRERAAWWRRDVRGGMRDPNTRCPRRSPPHCCHECLQAQKAPPGREQLGWPAPRPALRGGRDLQLLTSGGEALERTLPAEDGERLRQTGRLLAAADRDTHKHEDGAAVRQLGAIGLGADEALVENEA